MGSKLSMCKKGEEATPTKDAVFASSGMLADDQRSCTDLVCCILFSLFSIGMITIFAIGMVNGEPKRLIYGVDYAGNLCGVDPGVTDRPLLVYPRLAEDFLHNAQQDDPDSFQFYGICVTECPQFVRGEPSTSFKSMVCNNKINYRETADSYTQMKDCFFGSADTCTIGGESKTKSEVLANCWDLPWAHTDFLFRCLPKVESTEGNSTCAYPEGLAANDVRCQLLAVNEGVSYRPASAANSALFDKLGTAQALWSRYFGDLQKSWTIVMGVAVFLGLALGFIFMLFMQFFVGCVVWSILFLSITLTALAAFVAYFKAGLVDTSVLSSSSLGESLLSGSGSTLDTSEDNQSYYKYAAFGLTAVALIMVILVIAIRNSIRNSIRIMKLASNAVRHLPSLLILPFTNVLSILVLLIVWVLGAAALWSAGEITSTDIRANAADLASANSTLGNVPGLEELFAADMNSTNNEIEDFAPMDLRKYMFGYYLFGLLWTNQFINGMTIMTISGAVCAWYFSKDTRVGPKELKERKERYDEWVKEHPKETPSSDAPDALTNPIVDGQRLKLYRQFGITGRTETWKSMWRSIRYHMGTVACGSFLIAVIQFIRIILAYIDRKTKTLQKENCAVKVLLKCVHCCLWCFEKCVAIISRNAYVFTALKGGGFMSSARKTFKLIASNFVMLAFINVMTEAIIFLGKFFIAGGCMLVAFEVLDNQDPNDADSVTSAWFPALVTGVFAYMIAAAFFNVFDITVDTVLISYMTDKAENMIINGKDAPAHFQERSWLARARKKAAAAKARNRSSAESDSDEESDGEVSNPLITGSGTSASGAAAGDVELK